MFLLRYYGFRRMLAILIAVPLALLVRNAVGVSPPAGFYDWPYASQRAAAHLVSGISAIAYGWWLAVVTGWLLWLTPLAWLRSLELLKALVVAITAAPGAWLIVKAAGAMLASPISMLPTLLLAAVGTLLPAFVIGGGPYAGVVLVERLRSVDWLYSLLFSGRGSHASWCPPHQLRRFTKPIPGEL